MVDLRVINKPFFLPQSFMLSNTPTGIALLIGMVVISLLFHRIYEMQREIDHLNRYVKECVTYDDYMETVDFLVEDAVKRGAGF
jgi:hypothetical protein